MKSVLIIRPIFTDFLYVVLCTRCITVLLLAYNPKKYYKHK